MRDEVYACGSRTRLKEGPPKGDWRNFIVPQAFQLFCVTPCSYTMLLLRSNLQGQSAQLKYLFSAGFNLAPGLVFCSTQSYGFYAPWLCGWPLTLMTFTINLICVRSHSTLWHQYGAEDFAADHHWDCSFLQLMYKWQFPQRITRDDFLWDRKKRIVDIPSGIFEISRF